MSPTSEGPLKTEAPFFWKPPEQDTFRHNSRHGRDRREHHRKPSSASAKERLIPPTDCTRNGEKTSVDKPVHQKQTHAPRTADLSDFSSAAVWIFEESRPLKISAPQKKDEATVISTLLCFRSALHDGGKGLGIPRPGHIARKRSTQSKLRALPLP